MAEYGPLYRDGDRLPRTTSADTTAGQVVVVSGNDTVAPIAAPNEAWLGVAEHDALSGKPLVVATEGVWQVGATGAIAAGKPVIGATGGTVAAFTNGTDEPEEIIGTALSAAASSKVVIKLGR
ncbi:capsid cement protein [Mycobacterium kansasii]